MESTCFVALKRIQQIPNHPLAKDDVWREAVEKCLGTEALDLNSLAERRRESLGGQAVPLGFGDFFFDPNNPLHPDLMDPDFELDEEDEDNR